MCISIVTWVLTSWPRQSVHSPLTGSVGVPTVDLLIFNFINVIVVFCVCDSIGRLFGVHVCLLRFRSVVLVLSVSVPVLTLWSKKMKLSTKQKKRRTWQWVMFATSWWSNILLWSDVTLQLYYWQGFTGFLFFTSKSHLTFSVEGMWPGKDLPHPHRNADPVLG